MPYHHYISAFHLAEFSINPVRKRRQSRIWVHDLSQGTTWTTSASKAGGEGDYNGIENVPGLGSQSVESLINEKVETPASSVVRQINTDLRLPIGEQWESMLAYIALLQANNPSRRAALEESQNQALTFMARMMPTKPETIPEVQAEFRRDGVPILGNTPVKQLQDMGT